MTPDWMDEMLDRHPGEPVPPGFAERVRERIAEEEPGHRAPILRPRFGRLVSAAAAALLFLAIGFWLGRAGNPFEADPTVPSVVADLESDELEILRSWDLVVDEDIELGWGEVADQYVLGLTEEEGG